MDGRLSGKQILVVEDEYFIASDVKRALTGQAAIVVGPVSNAVRARALLGSHRIDAAVLDVNLEGSFSYELADELTAQGVPCLFVTGYDDWALPDPYRDMPRLAKPFSRTTLIESLGALLAEETAQ